MSTYRTEFHVHTKASHDSFLGKYALLVMCKLKKIDCVAITDHNEIVSAAQWGEFLKKYGIDVIVGEEIFTAEGEIIGLFLKDRIPSNLSAIETVKKIKEQDGIVYIPHPYDKKRHKTVITRKALNEIKNDVSCMEIHNGRNVGRDYSEKQRMLAKEYNCVPIVGGDAHCFFELGRNFVITSEPFSAENFLCALKSARFKSKPCILIAHKITIFPRLVTMIRDKGYREVCRAIIRRIIS